jgi:WD40 repeat protein
MATGKLNVFVSYARKDLAFAEQIVSALEARDIAPKIDTRDLPTLEDWKRELSGFIREADAVVSIVSPHSIASPICAWEVEQVTSLNKRLAPVVLQRVSDDGIPEGIARINYLFFDPPNSFDGQADKLAAALLTDRVWIKEHTRLGEAARRWNEHGRDAALLLRGRDIDAAERWIASRPRGAPDPIAAQAELITDSRRAAVRRQRATLIGSVAVTVVAAALAAAALWQRDLAQQQSRLAGLQRDSALMTQSRFLADLSRQHIDRRDEGTALLLALEALPDDIAGMHRPYVFEAGAQLARARQSLRERMTVSTASTDEIVFSTGGARIFEPRSRPTTHPPQTWDAATGKRVRVWLRGLDDFVAAAASSPDGLRIVGATVDRLGEDRRRNRVRIWNALSGNIIIPHDSPLARHDEKVEHLDFVAGGKRVLTVSRSREVATWDARTGEPAGPRFSIADPTLGPSHNEQERFLAASPDGARIITRSRSHSARLWDVATGQPLANRLWGYGGELVKALFSPDGRRVVTLSRDGALLWDSRTGTPVGPPLDGHTDVVWCAAFSADGTRVVTGSFDRTLRLWDAHTGLAVGTVMTGHTDAIQSVTFSADGQRIFSGARDASVRVWDVATTRQIDVIAVAQGAVRSTAVSQDGMTVATVGDNEALQLWRQDRDARLGRTLDGQPGTTRSLAFSPDGEQIATGATDGSIRLWSWRSGEAVGLPMLGHRDQIASLVFSRDGRRILSASLDGTARVWDAATGRQVAMLSGHSGFVVGAVFSPDGTRIATASLDKTARIWRADTGQPVGVALGHNSSVNTVMFSPDGRRLVTSHGWLMTWPPETTAQLWDAETGILIGKPLTGHTNYVTHAEFSRDGNRVVTASVDRTARLWDAQTGAPLSHFAAEHPNDVISAQFSPNGRVVVTLSRDGAARLWDAVSGKPIGEPLRGDRTSLNDGVLTVAFIGGSPHLITIHKDRTVQLWDSATAALLGVLQARAEWRSDRGYDMTTAAVSADGRRLAVVSKEHGVRLLALVPDGREWLQQVRAAAPRCLTREQRAAAFLEPAPPAWCIEMRKWPYHSQAWQEWLPRRISWLTSGRQGPDPELPTE